MFALFQNNNKDGANQRAEFAAMIEAAKSKIHQARASKHMFLSFCLYLLIVTCCLCLQYKVRAYIQMKSSKACKREIKSVMNTAGNVSVTSFI